jgi:IPT/TIG domain-containing protein/PASTA domain-containing protein
VLTAVMVAWALAAASAQAATTTVGQLFSPAAPCPGPSTILQGNVAIGTSYTIPAPGVITSWSFEDASPTVPSLKLKVARAVDAVNFTIVGEALAGNQTANAINTYSTSIPVQTGDLIGFYHGGGAPCGTNTGTAGDIYGQTPMDVTFGATAQFTGHTGGKFPVSVQETLQPGVSGVAPASGSTGGGTKLTITGHDFSGATAVDFGSTPAKSFTVNSDTSITAIAPAGAAGPADVTVTTPGGQSPTSASGRFTYSAPTVGSISPNRGPRTGGTTVTISGQGFTGATAVNFGGTPAKSFIVNSDTRITAVSPRAASGSVDVKVAAGSGQSTASAGDRFKFVQVCVVPNLEGKTLARAKKALRTAHCRIGKVTGPNSGRVTHQVPKPRKILRAKHTVSIKLA